MTRKTNRNAQGAGTIRQRKDGKWEARYTVGRNPGTGKQIQKSIYGDTQKEVLKKLQQVQTDLENGVYVEPSKMTVGAWVDTWLSEYLANVKQSTQAGYGGNIRKHIKPNLGYIPLQKLRAHHIQMLYNDLQHSGKSPKTVKNIHGTLHKALEQAVRLGYIKNNPSSLCTLPRIVKKDMKVLADDTVTAFLNAVSGHRHETIYFVDLFTGMRQGEILGLTWDCVDFESGTILICKQLVKEKKRQGEYFLDTTKHDKVRKIKPASLVMNKLRERKSQQAADQLRAGAAWSNPWGLVFTNELGRYISHKMVRKPYKRIVANMGIPDLRFHDLRHSYAVLSIVNGDDIKTVQENLGHHTAAFTLDTYGHVTDTMKEESAKRMDNYLRNIGKA